MSERFLLQLLTLHMSERFLLQLLILQSLVATKVTKPGRLINKNISFMKMLKNIGPTMDL